MSATRSNWNRRSVLRTSAAAATVAPLTGFTTDRTGGGAATATPPAGAAVAGDKPFNVPAYTAPSATESLVPTTIRRRAVGPRDVLIEIKFAGICHSDIHTVRGHWGPQTYPLVPGHEIAGIVTQVGSKVSRHRAGDRVGVGCMVNSCRTCANCRKGLEQYCLNGNVQTYGSVDRDGTITQGGYSTHVVVDEDFVLKIPKSIPLEKAAPILCAGVTTYSPLKHWRAGRGTKVAINGLGGLGHMGVQIAHALGAEVTVLSRTPGKKRDARRFGADHFHLTTEQSTLDKLAHTFDLVVNTVPQPVDLNRLMPMLTLDGVWVNVGAFAEPLPISVFMTFTNRLSFAGSGIGGIAETQEVLNFCAQHGITPEVEVIPADRINEAYDQVVAAEARYRYVIDTATLGRSHR
ncbi:MULTISPECIES: NAD(P)-dependent alcohol dehydrogenase [unclassified Streptomyces]|uniref:NAD(P)-dependent alcohol dehydrogenase n=1 Tax=unclassified Streptomyces TaxID=2593676 RepID=UPI002E79E4FC|nr:NAD(P)-dependent alcohol dehydrogenase [Streptomyces sp. JV176]MEE1804056.1 NAD(P)-dependent alcohol dehydrogenase [Streptomyces sp. JV176]